jgi:hypothetical protein
VSAPPSVRAAAVLGVAIQVEAPPAAEWLTHLRKAGEAGIDRVGVDANAVIHTLLCATVTLAIEQGKGIDSTRAVLCRTLLNVFERLAALPPGSHREVLGQAFQLAVARAQDIVQGERDRATIEAMRAAMPEPAAKAVVDDVVAKLVATGRVREVTADDEPELGPRTACAACGGAGCDRCCTEEVG